MPQPTHAELAHRLCNAKGISIAVADGTEPTDGYIVSLYGSELRIGPTCCTNGRPLYPLVRAWVATVQPNSHHRHQCLFVGRWTDDDGFNYFDLSIRCNTRSFAIDVARAHKQKAIYDVAKGETIPAEYEP